MTSNKNQIDDETLQRVVSLRTYMAKRAETLKIELEEVLKCKVDLLTYNSLHPLLKDQILAEQVEIL